VIPHHKFDLLLAVIHREKPRQCIIFCERKTWAHNLYEDLREEHVKVAVMHGDLEQAQRSRIMQRFREGTVQYLVATDVVGRGIDVTGISHIINYDLPLDSENYVHRIGRTGRMGKNGVAIAFVTPDQGQQLTDIELLINKEIPQDRHEAYAEFRPVRKEPEKQEPKEYVPVFGRRQKRYSRRL
jgi:ATP-dependent RNA helicase DeaD